MKPAVVFFLNFPFELPPMTNAPPSMRMPAAVKSRPVNAETSCEANTSVPKPRLTNVPVVPVRLFWTESVFPDGMSKGTSPVPEMSTTAYQVVLLAILTPKPPAASVTVPWLTVLFMPFV